MSPDRDARRLAKHQAWAAGAVPGPRPEARVKAVPKRRLHVRRGSSPRLEALLLHIASCPILSYVPIVSVDADEASDKIFSVFHLACGHSVKGTVHMVRWKTFAPCRECCPGTLSPHPYGADHGNG